MLSIIHIISFTVCTYIAAYAIESIIVTGWICSATGVIAGIAAIFSRQAILAAVSFLTPFVAVTLTALEITILNLGPERAALPFCIVFFVVQLTTNLISFRYLRFGEQSNQISIRTMLLATFAFAIVFSVARQLLQHEHNVLMLIALSMAGLTFVGIFLTISNWLISQEKTDPPKVEDAVDSR